MRSAQFQRPYNDVDIAIQNQDSAGLKNVLVNELGLVPDRAFNASHGDRRQLYSWQDEMEVDVFVDTFEQCQQLNLKPWLRHLDAVTLPRAVLLLTKLQIIQISPKDILDIVALVLDYPQIFKDAEVSLLLTRSWQWYTTVLDTMSAVRSRLPDQLNAEQAAKVIETLNQATRHLDQLPKSLVWKSRATLGRRVRWYELPEEK